MKIILGTAGLTGNYGRSGQCDNPKEVINTALAEGFSRFDTSLTYGNALSLLRGSGATIYAKVPKGPWEALEALESVPVFLRHNAAPRETLPTWTMGVSIYAADLPQWTAIPRGIVQIDWSPVHRQAMNLFDKPGVQVHLRSIYLQGALLGDVTGLPADVINAIQVFRKVARSVSTDPAFLALCMALAQPVDGIVIGVNSPQDVLRLKENLGKVPKDLDPIRSIINVIPSVTVDPRTWTSPQSIPTTTSTVPTSTKSSGSGSGSRDSISATGDYQPTPTTARLSALDPTPGGTSPKRRGRPLRPRT